MELLERITKVLEKIIEGIVSNSASCLVGMLFAYLNYQIRQMQADRKQKAEREDKARNRQEKVDLWLLRGELHRQMKLNLDIGYISHKSLATLEEGFALYEEMGGNGEIKVLMESIRELPHKKEL